MNKDPLGSYIDLKRASWLVLVRYQHRPLLEINNGNVVATLYRAIRFVVQLRKLLALMPKSMAVGGRTHAIFQRSLLLIRAALCSRDDW